MADTRDVTDIPEARTEATSHDRTWLTLSRVWAIVAVGVPTTILLGLRTPTVDAAYLIRAGNVMLHAHHVLRTDMFTFTVAGRSWVNQQWGAELLLAALYRLGGWAVLAVTRAVAGAVVFALVLLTCRARGASTRQAAWLTLGSATVGLGGFLVRPQMFALVLFAITAWILANRVKRPRALYAIPAIVALWANLHGSFFLGILLVGLAFLEDLRLKVPSARRLLVLAVVSAAAANIGPFGVRVWAYALDVSTNRVITRAVIEWQPPSVRDALGALFFASVAAVAAVFAVSKRRVPWTSLVTLGAFLLIGLFALRGIFWWAVVAPPLVVDALTRRTDADAPAGNRTANRAMAVVVGVLLVAFLPWWRLIGARSTESALLTEAPVDATSAVATEVPRGARLFVDQPLGSWFEFEIPQDRVFVDSRIELYPTSVWRQYFAVSGGRQDWERILAGWRVDVVVADRSDQRDLIPFIGRSPRWRLAYRDRDDLVFVRRR